MSTYIICIVFTFLKTINQGVSIIFLVDSSKYNLNQRYKRKDKVQEYLTSVYDNYKENPKIRFGLIAYHSWIFKLKILGNMNNSFEEAVGRLKAGGSWRYLHLAMKSSKAMFR